MSRHAARRRGRRPSRHAVPDISNGANNSLYLRLLPTVERLNYVFGVRIEPPIAGSRGVYRHFGRGGAEGSGRKNIKDHRKINIHYDGSPNVLAGLNAINLDEATLSAKSSLRGPRPRAPAPPPPGVRYVSRRLSSGGPAARAPLYYANSATKSGPSAHLANETCSCVNSFKRRARTGRAGAAAARCSRADSASRRREIPVYLHYFNGAIVQGRVLPRCIVADGRRRRVRATRRQPSLQCLLR
ncbi:hypothetical protein EVAR_52167_1 [Eumeta japonica]|uniref:Uncharacterized protein n=1 Tax=Eumeta variegata TaxID=151549 RepID=A0A4C1YCB4_EUMVA|nr:hypothetical protein EVAR_52167_1 [Eumeta japonica]